MASPDATQDAHPFFVLKIENNQVLAIFPFRRCVSKNDLFYKTIVRTLVQSNNLTRQSIRSCLVPPFLLFLFYFDRTYSHIGSRRVVYFAGPPKHFGFLTIMTHYDNI